MRLLISGLWSPLRDNLRWDFTLSRKLRTYSLTGWKLSLRFTTSARGRRSTLNCSLEGRGRKSCLLQGATQLGRRAFQKYPKKNFERVISQINSLFNWKKNNNKKWDFFLLFWWIDKHFFLSCRFSIESQPKVNEISQLWKKKTRD